MISRKFCFLFSGVFVHVGIVESPWNLNIIYTYSSAADQPIVATISRSLVLGAMEKGKPNCLAKEDATEIVPSQIITTANEVAGIDCVVHHDQLNAGFHPSDSSAMGTEEAAIEGQNSLSKLQAAHSVFVSMPAYPLGVHLENTKEVSFGNNAEENSSNYISNSAAISKNSNIPTKFYSRSVPKGSIFNETISNGTISKPFNLKLRNPNIHKPKNSPFNSFRTWSEKFERQISNLHGKHWETALGIDSQQPAEVEALSVDRYFDALEGPELDTLRASEEVLLPKDKTWPFLLRYPISSFSICLGISSQAIMWKTLATSTSTRFFHVSPDINLVLWCTSVALVAIVFFIYSLKVIFYFEAVRREYYHPIRINFFFAPWIALLFLALGVPPSICQNLHKSLWYILMTPIVCLEIKIYGQWMSGGQRRLSRVANPSNHLSVVGNFVGALLGASMGLKEGPVFFFAIGLAHYTVLFVTLYQRLPTNETLPKELHPVFFLFVAAPSVASMAWAKIQGSFDYGSRISYFIALFLYFSLAIRLNFFRGFRFSLAWWAYTFPMTGAAIATIRYSNVVKNVVTKTLTVFLCSVSTLTVGALLVTTIIHAFVLRDLFPNDIAIAISERRIESTPRWYHRRGGSSDMKDIEQYLKYRNSDDKDNDASLKSPSLIDQDASPCSR